MPRARDLRVQCLESQQPCVWCLSTAMVLLGGRGVLNLYTCTVDPIGRGGLNYLEICWLLWWLNLPSATNLCFQEKSVYSQEVLAVVLQQLLEQTPLPLLFMRTVSVNKFYLSPGTCTCTCRVLAIPLRVFVPGNSHQSTSLTWIWCTVYP